MIITVLVMSLIGAFTAGVVYWYITPTIMNILNVMEASGAPTEVIGTISLSYHAAFVVLIVGIVLYAIIYANKKETDSFRI